MMAIVAQHTQTPADDLVYGLDWDDLLGGGNLLSSEWASRDGAGMVHGALMSGNVTSFMFTGGEDGRDYIIDNLVTIDTGETQQHSVVIRVRA